MGTLLGWPWGWKRGTGDSPGVASGGKGTRGHLWGGSGGDTGTESPPRVALGWGDKGTVRTWGQPWGGQGMSWGHTRGPWGWHRGCQGGGHEHRRPPRVFLGWGGHESASQSPRRGWRREGTVPGLWGRCGVAGPPSRASQNYNSQHASLRTSFRWGALIGLGSRPVSGRVVGRCGERAGAEGRGHDGSGKHHGVVRAAAAAPGPSLPPLGTLTGTLGPPRPPPLSLSHSHGGGRSGPGPGEAGPEGWGGV